MANTEMMREIFSFYIENHPNGKNKEACTQYIESMKALVEDCQAIIIFFYTSYYLQYYIIKLLADKD